MRYFEGHVQIANGSAPCKIIFETLFCGWCNINRWVSAANPRRSRHANLDIMRNVSKTYFVLTVLAIQISKRLSGKFCIS
jgi:hypothetical protein